MPAYAQNRVVVGVDSPEQRSIVDIATGEARRLAVGLTILHAFGQPMVFGTLAWNEGYQTALDETQAAVRRLADDVRTANPDLDVRGEVVIGSAAYMLIEASKEARLTVVGCRGVGGFEELMLGSVSSQVAGHAHGPVLVIRPADAKTHTTGPIYVGIDGSPASEAALRFAFGEAAARKATLVVVHVWSPVVPASTPGYSVILDAVTEERAEQALLDHAVEAVTADFPDVGVERRLVEATSAEQVFVEASAHASLVVVGSRGRGGVTGLLLGSVSQALLHQAHCPIVVMHSRAS